MATLARSARREVKVIAVAASGASILLFGVLLLATAGLPIEVDTDITKAKVRALIISSTLLALSGAADSVSMICRTTMIHVAVPDVMRTRLQELFTVVVGGCLRVGDLDVGAVSDLALLSLVG